MSDLAGANLAAFTAAHDRLLALKGSSDVQALVERLVSGVLSFGAFLRALFALPSVQAELLAIDAGAAAGLGALVAGATPLGLGIFTGPAAAAAAKFVGEAITHRLAAA